MTGRGEQGKAEKTLIAGVLPSKPGGSTVGRKRRWVDKSLLAGSVLALTLLHHFFIIPIWAGRGRGLSDQELDATYAQGPSIARDSFCFRNGGGRRSCCCGIDT